MSSTLLGPQDGRSPDSARFTEWDHRRLMREIAVGLTLGFLAVQSSVLTTFLMGLLAIEPFGTLNLVVTGASPLGCSEGSETLAAMMARASRILDLLVFPSLLACYSALIRFLQIDRSAIVGLCVGIGSVVVGSLQVGVPGDRRLIPIYLLVCYLFACGIPNIRASLRSAAGRIIGK